MTTNRPLNLGDGRFVHFVEHDGKDYRVETRGEKITKVSVVYRRDAAFDWTHIWQKLPMDGKRAQAVIDAFIENVSDDGRNPDGTVA